MFILKGFWNYIIGLVLHQINKVRLGDLNHISYHTKVNVLWSAAYIKISAVYTKRRCNGACDIAVIDISGNIVILHNGVKTHFGATKFISMIAML